MNSQETGLGGVPYDATSICEYVNQFLNLKIFNIALKRMTKLQGFCFHHLKKSQ